MTTHHHYTKLQRLMIKDWLGQLVPDKKSKTDLDDLHLLLKDGVILVKLICSIANINPRDYLASISLEPQGNPALIEHNIQFFLHKCKELFNIDTEWSVSTLVNNLDIHAICDTFYKISELLERHHYEGPLLSNHNMRMKTTSSNNSTNNKGQSSDNSSRVFKTSSIIEELKQVSVGFVLSRLNTELNKNDPEYISTLASIFKFKDLTWCQDFSKMGGVTLIGKIITKLNYVYRTQKHKFIQGNYIYCLLILLEKEVFAPFITGDSIGFISTLTSIIDKKESLVTRKYVIDILFLLCNHSEEGFWIVLAGFYETFKSCQSQTRSKQQQQVLATTSSSTVGVAVVDQQKHQNRHPFDEMLNSMAWQRDDIYRGKVFSLINSMVSCPLDGFVRGRMLATFKKLGIEKIITSIENSHNVTNPVDSALREKMKEFEDISKKNSQYLMVDSVNSSDSVQSLKCLFLDLGIDNPSGIYFLLEAIKRKPTSQPPNQTSLSPSEENEYKMLQKLVRLQKRKVDKLEDSLKEKDKMSTEKFSLSEEEINSMSDLVELTDLKLKISSTLKQITSKERELKAISRNHIVQDKS